MRILCANLALFKELEEFLARFRGNPPILIKGAGLIAEGMRDMRERPMEDFDLLIRPDELPAAVETLADMGFSKMPRLLSQFRKGGLDFDLHTDIWYLERAEEELFRSRARPVAVGAGAARAPHPQDHLIYVLAHAAVHHGLPEPKWAEDVRALAGRAAADINLGDAAVRIKELGLGPAVSWFLRRSRIDLPELSAPLAANFFLERVLEAGFPYRSQLLSLIFVRDLRFRLRYAAKVLFPDGAFLARRHDLDSAGSIFFWRLARPFKFIAGFLISLAGLARAFISRPYQRGWREATAETLLKASSLARGAGRIALPVAAGLCNETAWARMAARRWDGMEEYRQKYLVDRGLFSFESRYQELLAPGARVALAGCGGGRDLIALARRGFSVAGLDISQASVEAARRSLKEKGFQGPVYCADAAQFVFPDGPYDAFIFSWVAYAYIPGTGRRVRALVNARRALAPGGRVLMTLKGRGSAAQGPTLRLARIVAVLTGNEFRLEPGDILHEGLVYEHRFTRSELSAEARAASLELELWEELPDAYGVDRLAVLRSSG